MGQDGDRILLERPKMSRAIWDSLKIHIMRERERKKQELEADAEVERERKERERREKEDTMTLMETNSQLRDLDGRLTDLKAEKHQLFLQLKKVLHEDDLRRRQNITKEAAEMASYGGDYMNMGHHHETRFEFPQVGATVKEEIVTAPQAIPVQVHHNPAHYQIQAPIPQPNTILMGVRQMATPTHQPYIPPTTSMSIVPQAQKRVRTPSPPPQQGLGSQGTSVLSQSYKFGPFKPPPQAIHSFPHGPPLPQQSGSGGPIYSVPGTLQFYPPPLTVRESVPSSQISSGPMGLNTSVSYGHGSYPHPAPHPQQHPQQHHATHHQPFPTRERELRREREESPKHSPHLHHSPHQPPPFFLHHQRQPHPQSPYLPPLPRNYVLHQHPQTTLEQSGKYPEGIGMLDSSKYFQHMNMLHRSPQGGHLSMPVHPSVALPPHTSGGGSITSGYPMRSNPSASQIQNAFQGRSPSPIGNYGPSVTPPRMTFGQHGVPNPQGAQANHHLHQQMGMMTQPIGLRYPLNIAAMGRERD